MPSKNPSVHGCDGLFKLELCRGADCQVHDKKHPNHLTGYVVCDCGFRCERSDMDARRRHHGGLN